MVAVESGAGLGEHVAVAVGRGDWAEVAVYVKACVEDHASVGDDGGRTAWVDVAPVKFEANTVVAVRQVGRDCECRRIEYVAAASGRFRAVAEIAFGARNGFDVGISHDVAAFGDGVVVVECSLELAVVAAVEIDVAVQPGVGVAKGGRKSFSCFGREALVKQGVVDGSRVERAPVHGLVAVGRAFEGDAGELTCIVVDSGVLIIIDDVVSHAETGCGTVVDDNLVDKDCIVSRQCVRRLAVGHDDEAVNVDSAGSFDREHSVAPFAGCGRQRGERPELFGFG